MKLFPKNGFLALLCLCRSHPRYRKKYPNAALVMRDLLVLARFGARHPRTLLALRWLSGWLTRIPGLPVPQTAGSQPDLISAGEWISSGPAPAKRVEGFVPTLPGFVTFLVKQKSKAKKKHGCGDPGKTVHLQINKGRSAITRTSPRLAFLHNRSRLSWLAPTFLCLLFLNGKVAEAQSPATVAGDIPVLDVGDEFPYPLLDKVLFTESGTLDLSEYRGKLLILDFWATWCAGCVVAFPKNDQLLDDFEGRLAIVAVTYEPNEKVLPFLGKLREKRGWKLGMDFSSDHGTLATMFPHQTLPHYVWIGPDGRVAAVTQTSALIPGNIQKVLSGEALTVSKKVDNLLPLHREDLFLAGNGQLGTKPILYQSALTAHVERLSGEVVLAPPPIEGASRILLVNRSISELAVFAFGEGDNRKYYGDNRLVVEVEDPDRVKPGQAVRGDAYREWLRHNSYSYELLYPGQDGLRGFRYMQEDLRRYFPEYSFEIEVRGKDVWQIVHSDGPQKYAAEPGQELRFEFGFDGGTIQNIMLNGLVGYLNMYFLHDSPFPVVDCTGIESPVTLTLDADMRDPLSIAAALRPYGLDMVRGRMPLEVLVIRDSGYKNNKP